MYLKLSLLLLLSPTLAFSKITFLDSEKKVITDKIAKILSVNESHLEAILEGDVVGQAKVVDENKIQSMNLFTVGIHPKSCERAMKKISRYEEYKTFMSFIKESTYNESTHMIYLLINHSLMPFPMSLDFKLPRITGPGEYPFVFPTGIFANLQGTIIVEKLPRHCLLTMKADWKGKHTGVSNIIVESFAQTLSRIGLEHLIRFSSI